jgi:hypothetical protein
MADQFQKEWLLSIAKTKSEKEAAEKVIFNRLLGKEA